MLVSERETWMRVGQVQTGGQSRLPQPIGIAPASRDFALPPPYPPPHAGEGREGAIGQHGQRRTKARVN